MSYLVDQSRSPSRRRWWLAAALVLAVGAGSIGAFVLGRDTGQPSPSSPADSVTRPPSSAMSRMAGSFDPLTWSVVGADQVPASPVHGPREQIGGLARGFTHDEAGAVLAAVNISVRISSAVPRNVRDSVLAEQTVGDVPRMRTGLEQQVSTVPRDETRVRQWFWSIDSGDPRGDLVRVSLVADTAQTARRGGYGRLVRTLVWRDGDWRLQVPVDQAQLVHSTAGHQLLGGPR